MTYIDLTDDYLAGNLSAEEYTRFEDALKTSAELRTELALARSIRNALRAGEPDPAHHAFVEEIHRAHLTAQQDLIEKYHNGNASGDERARFREQLETDELFAFEVKLYRERVGWRAKALNMQKGMQWAAAAAAVMVLVVAGWWAFGNSERRDEQLFARYDVPELFPEARYALVNEGFRHRGMIDSDEFSELKIKGLQAYEERDWDTAIRLLSAYISRTKPSEEEMYDEINFVNLYIGRALLEKGQAAKAVAVLQIADAGVTDLDNYALRRELIRWNLALAHLKNHNPASAKSVLYSLRIAEREDIRQQAKNLLNDLK